MAARSLHYVFRVANRLKSYEFYTKTLQMKVLRHEEFHDPCEASCNGPFDGSWSKTMVGYGHEDKHFVLELTYNYAVGSYQLGNDYDAIHIEHDGVYQELKGKVEKGPESSLVVADPDGHRFYIYPGKTEYPVRRVSLHVTQLARSARFWAQHLGMTESTHSDTACVLTYGHDQCALELHQLPSTTPLDRGTAFGRLAFSYPTADLKALQEKVRNVDPHFIQTELIELPTPGKASVWVVILRDPDEHEICFVGEKEYQALSQFDHNADHLLQEAISKDDSDQWYNKLGKK